MHGKGELRFVIPHAVNKVFYVHAHGKGHLRMVLISSHITMHTWKGKECAQITSITRVSKFS